LKDRYQTTIGNPFGTKIIWQNALIERGAIHTKAANFQAHIEVADRLVTGQNSASASGVGEKMVELIRSRS
jgi:putative intracellular protease/amidase